MKELSIEEKAKRYDEAIEIAKEINNEQQAQPFNVMTRVFPELKESEDERIRKELLNAFQESEDSLYMVLTPHRRESFISWLEKQGGQKPADGIPYPETLEKAIDLYYYSYGNGEGEFEHLSLEKFRDIVHTFVSDYGQKPAWSEEDEKKLLCVCAWIKDYPRIADFKDEMYTVANNYIDWLKSLKDRVLPQTKQEWSEEDEEIIDWLENEINGRYYIDSPLINPIIPKTINWLKFLKYRVQPQINVTDEELAQAKKDAYNDVLDKLEYDSENPTFDDGWSAAIWYLKKRNAQPQNTWKPSDEHMAVLNEVINYAANSELQHWSNFIYTLLKSLREQLKKLREE